MISTQADRRETYRQEAARLNSLCAWAIRHCGGLYFAGFGGKPEQPKVKWTSSLADAKLFGATAQAQVEKYIARIKHKDSLYVGLKAIKVSIAGATTDGSAAK